MRKRRTAWWAVLCAVFAAAATDSGARAEQPPGNDADARLQKTAGPVKLSYTMPFDGFATLVIDDQDGRRVKNLIAMAPRTKGELADFWDCTAEDGKLAPPGTYRFRGLLHRGIEPVYAASYGCAATLPEDGGTGGWLSESSAPRAAAAGNGLVVLAAERAEVGASIIGVDLNGRRVWGNRRLSGIRFLAADDRYVYVLEAAKGARPVIERLDLKTGKQTPFKAAVFQGAEAPAVIQGCVIGGIAVGRDRLAVSVIDAAGTQAPKKKPAAKGDLDLDDLDLPADPDEQLVPEDAGDAFGAGGDAVRFYDKENGRLIGQRALSKPGCLTYDANGVLYVCSGDPVASDPVASDRIVRLAGGKLTPVAKVTPGSASSITVDAAGQLFVADRAAHQVRVFDRNGKPVRTVGAPGGRMAGGAWRPGGMLNPAAIAVDDQGRLWVAEDDPSPKRVSVWDADGKLAMDFIGPASRAAWDATADPEDTERVFGSGTEFRLDYKTGRATVAAGGLTGASGQLMKIQGREYFMARNGRLYLRTEAGPASAGGLRLVAAMDSFVWRDAPAFKAFPIAPTVEWEGDGSPSGHHWACSSSFLWMDLNDDGTAQAEETTAGSRVARSKDWMYPFGVAGNTGSYWLDEGLNLYSCGCETSYYYPPGMGPVVIKVPLKGWTPGGAPIWNLRKQQLVIGVMKSSSYGEPSGPVKYTGALKGFEVDLPNGQGLFSNGQCNWFPGECLYLPAGGRVVVGPPITCVRDDGTILWTYKDDWPGPLRAYWDKPVPVIDRDDALMLPSGCIGRMRTPLGTVFAIQSSIGRMYLMTMDGLFIAGVFRDFRLNPAPWPNDARPGTSLKDVTMGREWTGGHFFGSAKSGESYLIAGSVRDGALGSYDVIKLNGFDTLQAIPGGPLTVTAQDVQAAAKD